MFRGLAIRKYDLLVVRVLDDLLVLRVWRTVERTVISDKCKLPSRYSNRTPESQKYGTRVACPFRVVPIAHRVMGATDRHLSAATEPVVSV